MIKRIGIQIEGRVQGVGFRPFVYQLAKKYQLSGWVLNNEEGVRLEVQGGEVEAFTHALVEEKPEAAHISNIKMSTLVPIEESLFLIKESPIKVKEGSIKNSHKIEKRSIEVPPDRRICNRCLAELYTPENRRYRDPLINCSQCGPRFTIIRSLPYDRGQTAMAPFKWCKVCEDEYINPMNDRFHTESICCPQCEPKLILYDELKKRRDALEEPIQALRQHLQEGKIAAIKGVGGYHLASIIEKDLINELRIRKKRDLRPLAIMVKDLVVAKNYGQISKEEAALLNSHKAPIVLVKKNPHFALGEILAPNTDSIGMMLPYTALHHLLFEEGIEALVMTSGNKSGEPIYYEDEKALTELLEVADCLLLHERSIEIGIDDSVTHIIGGQEQIIRRARGYVPEPVHLTYLKERLGLLPSNGLACGGDMKNTFCMLREDQAYVSQHMGSLESVENLAFYKKGIGHFSNLLDCKVQWIAHDLHPHYMTTKYAKGLKDKPLIGIQHHKAHLASCMVENQLIKPVIGVVYDGTGYGEDGQVWGGEFFVGDLANFERVGHLQYIKMLGGEKAIKEPWRMAYSYLMDLEQEMGVSLAAKRHKLYKQFEKLSLEEGEKLLEVSWQRSLWMPYTSSMGRLFDAVAALLGKGEKVHYEAEAAIWLEYQVKTLEQEGYPYEIKEGLTHKWIVEWKQTLQALMEDQDQGESISVIASKFHQTVIKMTIEMCQKLRFRYNIEQVALSGGVFQNRFLLEGCISGLTKVGFKVYWQKQIPTNDGGISLGQCALAWIRSQEGEI